MIEDDPTDREAPTEDYNSSNFSELDGSGSPGSSVGNDSRRVEPPIGDIHAGDVYGSYELIERVGEGAYGVVWRAWDSKLKRHVALKFLLACADSRENLSRFRQEQEILAQLKHPNLATVFDSGVSATGRPFFAMEFVKGATLTSFCDGEKLDLRRRLELFVLICDAVQFAHSNNIAHRDLKPANILVEFGPDRTPRPVVIDFGVARSMVEGLVGRDHHTRTYTPMGTLEYMSPEQVLPRGTAVDNLSDVYALGVILYELLVGFAPFDFSKQRKEKDLREIQRVVSDVDPPTPSSRLSTIAVVDGELGEKIARARRVQLSALQGVLADELQWIPLKAIKKERMERYQTASALAEDVRRFLDGSPIQAAPDSALYRTRKFVRRNRAGVAIVSAVALGLGAGTVGHVRGELAAGELEVRKMQSQVDSARQRELESRKNLLALQRASLLEILAPLLSEEIERATDSGSTLRIVEARTDAAEAWARFCDRPDPAPDDRESIGELVSDLRVLGEAAIGAARWANSARINATGGGDPAKRARWMSVAEGAQARILRFAPHSPEAEYLAALLARSEIDALYSQGKYDEVVGIGSVLLGTAAQVLARQTDPEWRRVLESELGRVRTTVADSLSKRTKAMLRKSAETAGVAAESSDVANAIAADRRRELELRQYEVERRRRICDDPMLVSSQARHDLMIAIDRLAWWYADPDCAALFDDAGEAEIAREREIALDSEYRERFLRTSASERSDQERVEFAAWCVRDADSMVFRPGTPEQHAARKAALQDAIDHEVGLCIQLVWGNPGDARVPERLAAIQAGYLGDAANLDPQWVERCTMRIANMIVIPAEAATAERRMSPAIALSMRILRLGSWVRRARIAAATNADESMRMAESAVIEARALLAEVSLASGVSKSSRRSLAVEVRLASALGHELGVQFAAELAAELEAHATPPQ